MNLDSDSRSDEAGRPATEVDAFPEIAPPAPGGEQDSAQERRATRRFLRQLYQCARPFRGRFALAMGLTLARAGCLGLAVFLFQRLVGTLLPAAGGFALEPFLGAALALLACQIAAAVFENLGQEAQRWFLEGVEVNVLQWSVEHLVQLDLNYFRERSLAPFVVRLEKLQIVVRSYLTSFLTVVSRSVAVGGVGIGVLASVPLLGSITVAVALGLTWWVWHWLRRHRQLAKQEFSLEMNFASQIDRVFSNVREYLNFGMLGKVMSELDGSCQMLAARSLRRAKVYNGAAVLLTTGGVVVLSGMVGGAFLTGSAIAGPLTCFAAMGMMLDPLGQVLRAENMRQTRAVKLTDLVQLIDELQAADRLATGAALEGPIERLSLEAVSFGRRGATIIHAADLELRRGEVVGLIGRSGAGKTTLAKLMLRLEEPTSGRVLVNGMDASSIDLPSYWRRCAYVPQMPCVVGRTVAEEVGFALPAAARGEIEAALLEAGIPAELADQTIEISDGDDDPAEEWDTRSLRQRLEWARAAVRRASLVVFDEPTSMVEAAEEAWFVEAVRRRRAERITVVVSHRPATLAACDRIVVVADGRVVDEGRREAMLGKWLPDVEAAELAACA